MARQRFPIRIDAWFRPVMAMAFLRPSRCYVELGDQALEVRMDWAFRAELLRDDVRGAAPEPTAPLAWGVHGFAGRWLVNGSMQGLVAFSLREGVRARVLGVRVKLRRLVVSVEDPRALLAALSAPA
jgi:hypothetical protein